MALSDIWIKTYAEGGLQALQREFNLSPGELSELLVLRASDGGVSWAAELVSAGADPNFIDDEGNTALSMCIHSSATPIGNVPKSESFELAVELVALGASQNASYQGMSLLELAVSYDRADIAALFLLAGANTEAVNPDYGRTTEERMRLSERPRATLLLEIAKKRRA